MFIGGIVILYLHQSDCSSRPMPMSNLHLESLFLHKLSDIYKVISRESYIMAHFKLRGIFFCLGMKLPNELPKYGFN